MPELEAKESKLAGIPEDEEDCKKPSTCRIEVFRNPLNVLSLQLMGFSAGLPKS